ncbi:MAG: hypothetical protein R3287_07865 [Anderseniella sp.]|jgi:hypothetical protein|nr:hypothetical protein [Anderseniella sp.]
MQPFTSKFAMPKAALGLVACLVLAGCNSYSHMTRSDKISPAAGDAVYAARTMQTVDPWPEYVLDTDIAMDGELAHKRATDYKAGNTKPLEAERSGGGSTAQP